MAHTIPHGSAAAVIETPHAPSCERRAAVRRLVAAAPRFDGRDFDRVQAWALANVETLAAEYAGVQLRRGRCACPIHGGDNPGAFSVTNGQGWHCFTGECGSGDGVDLVRRLRFAGLSDKDGRIAALRELAPRAGVFLDDRAPRTEHPPGAVPVAPPAAPAPSDPYDVLRAAGIIPASRVEVQGAACVQGMTLGPKGRAYLESRGFTADTAAAFGFRSLEHGREWHALLTTLAESYLPEELAAAGVPLTLPFVPCLVIPYHTPAGAVWGWRLRSLEGEKRYHTFKGHTFPNPFNAPALEGLTAADTVHIVEGELNAYALALTGARAVGLSGAGTWRPEWTAAVCAAGKLVLWYDDDDAGNKGYTRLVDVLLPVLGRTGTLARVRRVRISTTAAPATGTPDANDLYRTGRLSPLMESAPWME
jgi:DNA primase